MSGCQFPPTVQNEVELGCPLGQVLTDQVRDLLTLPQQLLGIVLSLCDSSAKDRRTRRRINTPYIRPIRAMWSRSPMQKTPDPPTPVASIRALLYAVLLTTTALRTSLPTPGSTLSSKSRPILLKISDSISSFGLDSTRSEMFTYCAHAHPRATSHESVTVCR